MSSSLPFVQRAWPALAFGFALTFASSAGQTYFISLSSGAIRDELGLSHGGFGTLYTVATTASALVLVWLGKLADRYDLVTLGAICVAVLAVVCAVGMGSAQSWLGLGIAVFGLRLAGQGMLSHLSMTAMGRWFSRERGRALSVAVLGFTAAEALLPFLGALALATWSWRTLWWIAAGVLLAVMLPLVLWAGQLAKGRGLDQPTEADAASTSTPVRQWTRSEVVRDPRFYALLPGVLAPPFIVTGVLFHQVHLVEQKGWSLPAFAATYPFYAGAATAVALGLGFVIDRFGAVRLLPYYLLPIATGLLVLSVTQSLVGAAVFMALMGASAGGATLVIGALWAELYGVTHLGAIRALAVSLMVFSTALAPGLMGWLIDAGMSIDWQYRMLAAYVVVGIALFAVLQPSLGLRQHSAW
ncbi:MAG: MFS transporter [Pseudomonadota bacterium]